MLLSLMLLPMPFRALTPPSSPRRQPLRRFRFFAANIFFVAADMPPPRYFTSYMADAMKLASATAIFRVVFATIFSY